MYYEDSQYFDLFCEKECCLRKLKESKKFLRSSSVEIQGQILRASGDRAKAQGRHNAEGGLKEKIPTQNMLP